ncbi:MAG TPA: TonB-dependent receptor, partial [Candidatus Krumholzibacteria bacterium]|nr:TonB-dependent receptor [Candidatus Krumholzibacteria bacterium]
MNTPLNARKPRASTQQKALEFNLDPLVYGSLAEIGAGQEVARHFFQAGGASGTIAKTTSAYDMRFSDAIYGADSTGRYVTRERLVRMLDHEYALIIERVALTRNPESRYFVFADTVAARRFGVESEDHGWLGMLFQHAAGAVPSRVILHVRLFDTTNQEQQAALGVLGVNLIDSCFRYHDDPDQLVDSLTENLAWGRVEIDSIELDGPAFIGVDRCAVALRLVSSSQGPVVVFSPEGRIERPSDVLYRKVPLIIRGTFRPFTNVHLDMIARGREGLAAELGVRPESVVVFCEMNIARHLYEGVDEVSDLQARVEMINALGMHAMVTSHLRFFRLSEYFQRHALQR